MKILLFFIWKVLVVYCLLQVLWTYTLFWHIINHEFSLAEVGLLIIIRNAIRMNYSDLQ